MQWAKAKTRSVELAVAMTNKVFISRYISLLLRPNFLQSKFTILGRAKDYGLFRRKTAIANYHRLNVANLMAHVSRELSVGMLLL